MPKTIPVDSHKHPGTNATCRWGAQSSPKMQNTLTLQVKLILKDTVVLSVPWEPVYSNMPSDETTKAQCKVMGQC